MNSRGWDMRLSKKGEYTLRALMELAYQNGNGLLSIEEIAQRADVPKSFLEQILLQLKHARFLESRRGAEGGYRLKRSPESICIGEVIRLIDGPLAPLTDREALEDLASNGNARYRGLYGRLLDVRNAISEILDATTLADLCRGESPAREISQS